jgi:hypothetical protein
MSDLTLAFNRPLSPAEQEEFRALGLSPGNWLALAPLPLVRADLSPPPSHDLRTLEMLQNPLRTALPRGLDAEREAEAAALWKGVCSRSLRPEELDAGNALLAWYLVTRIPRTQRESYLTVLENTAVRFYKSPRTLAPAASPSYDVRQRIDRFQPHRAYTRYPADPRLQPPTAIEVSKLFGQDLWKQLLVAPIASALAELQVRPPRAASVATELARVSGPESYGKPSALEVYLSAGSWRRFFEGLLDPAKRLITEPLIHSGLQLAAQGLASLPFSEREIVLRSIHDQIARGIDRPDLRKVTADDSIDRLRAMIEDELRHAAPMTGPPPPAPSSPPPAAAAPGPSATDSRPSQPTIPVTMPPPLPPIPVSPASPPKPAVTVERAQAFTQVTFSEALARANAVSFAEVKAWLANPKPLLFDDQRTECSEVAIIRDEAAVPPMLWVIGDLHADVLTLANIIAYAEHVASSEGTPPAYMFLGDLVDRGRHDHETLMLLVQLILKDPTRVCIVPGNHDIDLQWDEKAGRFRVTIEPAEYCEHLNGLLGSNEPRAREEIEFAQLLIPFWRQRPKAVVFPDGTLFAHAGFPHSDMQTLLASPADLARAQCVNDFLWARIAETARKRPNRGNRGHEFGWETFAGFCKKTVQIGLPAVKRFVRGHDHVPRRWQTYPEYAEHPVLTINAMGRRMDGEPDPAEGPHPYPVMARVAANALPLVVQLPLDPNEVNRAFGKVPAPADSALGAHATPGDATGNAANGLISEAKPNPASDDRPV